MTDPTPAAPNALPEAVEAATDALVVRAGDFRQHRTDAAVLSLRDSRRDLRAAIAAALREATETRDREIARLTAELAAAREDTARLDFLLRHRYETTIQQGIAEIEVEDVEDAVFCGIDIRAAIDAARAAEDEP